MQRNQIRRVVILVFLVVGVTVGYNISKKIEEKNELEVTLQSMSFEGIEFLDDAHTLENNQIIFTFFHPSCDFCQADAEEFKKSHTDLKDFEVLWVSYDEKDSIQKFSKTYGLDTLPNMHFAYMNIEAMLERYGNVKFPTFLAYDNNGQLIKKFVGLTKPEEILQAYKDAGD